MDWEDAPLPYKLYNGLTVIPLSLEVPLTLKRMEVTAKLDLSNIGHFLRYVFGLTQFGESKLDGEYSTPAMRATCSCNTAARSSSPAEAAW